jgi:glycosyltransferase involved in cell wall biosynthesis
VVCYDSGDLQPGLFGKWRAFTSGVYAREPTRRVATLIEEFRPDVVHVYELYPLISPWILPECRRRGVPVVMTCYDYRLSCPVATHYRNGEICARCTGGREHWAVLHNCRGSLPESVAFALRSAVARRWELFRDPISRFITPTRFAAQWLVEHAQLPAEKVVTIPCLIDMPETGVDPAEGRYVGFAGRFVPEKGKSTSGTGGSPSAGPLVIA